jgi:hypothetical protein
MSEGLGILVSLSGVLRLFIDTGAAPTDPGERLGYITSSVVLYGMGILSILISPMVIYGAVQMLNGRKYASAKFAALLAMIPLTSCFFIAAMPIGAWALITLGKLDVKESFTDGLPPRP